MQDARPAVTASSPDGSLVLTVSTDNDSRANWALTRRGKALIAPSKLGFLLSDGLNMVRGFTLNGSERGSGDDTREQPWGERRYVRNHYNELTVRFRLFDNGIGFRYELPEQPAFKTIRIAEELTEYRIVPQGTAWWITGRGWNRYEQV